MFAPIGANASDIDGAIEAARAYHQENGPEIVRDFADLLSIPNNALDSEKHPAQCRRNFQHVCGARFRDDPT